MLSKSYLRWVLGNLVAVWILLVWTGVPMAQTIGDSDRIKRVLLLYSDERRLPAGIIVDRVLRETLEEQLGGAVEIHSEYLDQARFPGDDFAERQRAFLQDKYAGRMPDLIVAGGTAALNFLVEFRGSLFKGVPIVHCAVPEQHLVQSMPDEAIVGIPLALLYASSLELALQLQPGIRKVAVVIGTSERDRTFLEAFRRTASRFEPEIAFTWLTDLSIEELGKQLSRLPKESVVLYLGMFEDAKGRTFVPQQALEIFAPSSVAPIYGAYDTYLGHGIVGGMMVTFEEIGREAAHIAIRIMNGMTPAEATNFEPYQARPMFDWKEVKRWGLEKSRFPPGSLFLNREPSFWETHGTIILLSGAICLFEAGLIVLLIRQIRRRRKAETAARDLSGRLIHAQEEAQARLARELHDDLSQRLALLAVEMEMFGQHSAASQPSVPSRVQPFVSQVKTIASDVHRLAHNLHPAKLDELGLEAALRSFCREFSLAHQLAIRFEAIEVPRIIPDDVALCLYRIAQEALHNVVKHSSATEADVGLAWADEELTLVIADNGIGFDPASNAGYSSLGVIAMEERVRFVHGGFSIRRQAEGGTKVAARIPLPQELAGTVESLATDPSQRHSQI